jgi:hypothetical protein
MKWTLFIQQKLKVAGLLGLVIVIVIITNLVERKRVDDMGDSFISFYRDRLVPAADIFYFAENLYQKHLYVQKYLLVKDPESLSNMSKVLQRHNSVIDSLVRAFDQTYQVETEYLCFDGFKSKINHYKDLEQTIVTLSEGGQLQHAHDVFNQKAAPLFRELMADLKELTEIQTEVGLSMINTSMGSVAGSQLISNLQIGLILLIGIIIEVLILTSRVIKTRQKQKFNLN